MKSAAAKTTGADLSADEFVRRLTLLQSDEELRKIQRYFRSGPGEYGEGDRFIGVRMGSLFALAKDFAEMEPAAIDQLLGSDIHEVRAGALSIMAKQYALKKTTEARRGELYGLYMRRHDRINNWDLVDLAAWHVVGPYLRDKSRDVLYRLAKSDSIWERRTAILATMSFFGLGQMDDAMAIAGMLLKDEEELIHKAVGGVLRSAGDKDRPRLVAFLDAHAATMPRVMLRYALEHFEPDERARYMAMGKQKAKAARPASPQPSGRGRAKTR